MKFRILFLLHLGAIFSNAQEAALAPEAQKNIQQLIQVFQNGRPEAIAALFIYPVERSYPVPAIRDQKEFLRRFDEVLDQSIIATIANSSLDRWSQVGWRGIMLDNGTLWLDDSGEKISGINHQTQEGTAVLEAFLKKDKEGLPSSLRNFHRPDYKIKTKKYRIRIDELEDHTYRYISWKKEKPESAAPDLVLHKGVFEAEGTGGNHRYVFTNGIYQYIVYRNVMGEGDPAPITLEVLKNNKVLLREDGELILE